MSINERGEKYGDDAEYTQECCLPVNQERFRIKCTDSWGDGWTGGYLEINGKQYCKDFFNGNEREESMPNRKAPEGPG